MSVVLSKDNLVENKKNVFFSNQTFFRVISAFILRHKKYHHDAEGFPNFCLIVMF